MTGQTNVAAEMKPATAQWKYFLAISRIARSHVRFYVSARTDQQLGKIPRRPPA